MSYLQQLVIAVVLCFSMVLFAQSGGDLVITEVMANPAAVGDAVGEYVELYNTTGVPIDINGFILRDDDTDSHIIDNGGPLLVPAQGFLVLGASTDPSVNGGFTTPYAFATFFVGNGGDEVVLETPGGTEICRLNYTDGDPFGPGVSMELGNITLSVGGVTQQGDYVAATSQYGQGDFGSPNLAGNTQGTGGGDPPPAISGLSRTPRVPAAADDLNVSATITDDSDVTLAELRYLVNGGSEVTVTMTDLGAGMYTADIPASAYGDGDRVEYYIYAEDDAPQSATSARLNLFAGTTPIGSLLPVDGDGVLIYDGHDARIRAVATVGSNTFHPLNLDVYVQDASGGINIFGFGLDSLVDVTLGNDYTIVGMLDQFNGKSELIPDATAPDIIDHGPGTLPAEQRVTIAQLLANPEAYEGELIVIAAVTNTGGGQAWPDTLGTFSRNIEITDDGGSSVLTLRIDDDTDIIGTPEPTWPIAVRGIAGQFDSSLPYTDGYQMLPRSLGDLDVQVGITIVDDRQTVDDFRLFANYPNPFNPSTQLRFAVPGANGRQDVRVDVFNALGQHVRTLVDAPLAGGRYELEWDGHSDAGVPATSGVYFAVLKADRVQLSMRMVLAR